MSSEVEAVVQIVHLVESFESGTREVVLQLARSQVRNGHQVIVLHGQNGRIPFIKDVDDPVFHEISGQSNRRLGSIWRAWWFLQCSEEWRTAELIHLHSSFAGGIGRLALRAARAKRKCLYTPHGIGFLCDSPMRRWAIARIESLLNRLAPSLYVACSLSEAVRIKEELRGTKVVVVENGVTDPSESLAKEVRSTIAIGQVTLIAVGRICRQKNYRDLIELSKIGIKGLRIQLVGDGDPEEKKALVAAGVEVLGWLPKAQVLSRIRTADALIQPSLWEGLSLTVLEAMALSKPIVARRCVGNVDAIDSENGGWLYDDLDCLKKIVSRLVQSPESIESMGDAARQRYCKRFRVERMVKNYRVLYESL